MTPPELKILIGLHRTVNRIDRETAKLAAKYGVTLGQFAVLEALYHKGDLTVGQVQQKILSTTGTIPVIVQNLEKQGYLSRLTDDNDRRRSILHITQKGCILMEQLYPENEQKIIEMLSQLTGDEKTALIGLLKKTGDYNETKNN